MQRMIRVGNFEKLETLPYFYGEYEFIKESGDSPVEGTSSTYSDSGFKYIDGQGEVTCHTDGMSVSDLDKHYLDRGWKVVMIQPLGISTGGQAKRWSDHGHSLVVIEKE